MLRTSTPTPRHARGRVPLLVLLFLVASLAPQQRAGCEDAAPGAGAKVEEAQPVVDIRPHDDKDVAKALERFKIRFAKPSVDQQLSTLQWIGRYRHKKVLKTLKKILFRHKNLELRAMAAQGIGNQFSEAKSARKSLNEAVKKFKRYGSRANPEDDEIEAINNEEAQILVACIDSLRKLHPHAPRRHKRDGWDDLAPMIDHRSDAVAVAMFRYCGATKELRGLKRIVAWFNYYPDGYSWAGASATVDTGAAGTADADAARSAVQGMMAGRVKKARPDAHAEMVKCVKELTGKDMKDPKELVAWMKANKQMLKRAGA